MKQEMLKAVMIDDEISSLRSLEFEIKNYCPELEIAGTFQKPAEALKQIPELAPDLVFLDIEMPEMNGFEFLEALPGIKFDVIFVTAYDQFAIKAFDFNAIDYLLKPVRKVKLIQSVQKVVDKKSHGMDNARLEALVQNIRVQSHQDRMQSIALPTGEGFSMVNVSDIDYLQADSNYTWVHLSSGQKHLISRTLKEFVGMLDYSYFFRPHKSYLVNLNHLDRYVRGQGGFLVMKNGDQIPVARGQKSELMRVLNI